MGDRTAVVPGALLVPHLKQGWTLASINDPATYRNAMSKLLQLEKEADPPALCIAVRPMERMGARPTWLLVLLLGTVVWVIDAGEVRVLQ